MSVLTLSRLSTKSRQAPGGCRQKLTTGIGISSRKQCKRDVRPLWPARGEKNKRTIYSKSTHLSVDVVGYNMMDNTKSKE